MSEGTNIHFTEDGFAEPHAAASKLYVYQDGMNGQLAILGADRDLWALREWKEDDQEQDDLHELLQWPYAQRQVLLPHRRLTFIPNELYDESQTALYRQLLTDNEEEPIYTYHFKNIPVKFLYTVYGEASLSGQSLIAEECIPAAAPWIESMALMGANEFSFLGIQLHHDTCDYVYFKDGGLIFYNRFPKADADEFNYFLLCVIEECHINPEKTHVVFAGNVRPGDENYQRISKYFSQIQLAPIAGLIQTGEASIYDQGQRLLNLLGIALCE
ncbi:Protein of unknown function [bacterium A37T11]|nr:Protein of unknown function [bacterium A37T11]